MPSTNPTIAVRLPPAMYKRVVELAAQDGRSLSNFVEHNLRRLVTPDLSPAFPRAAKRRKDRPVTARPKRRGKVR